MTTPQDQPVFSRNVMEMITVANDYCLTLTKYENLPTSELYSYLQKVCPLIYLKGALLPDVDVNNPEANERFFTEEEWEALFNGLRNKFKKEDEFWTLDFTSNHNDPVKISLSECLADLFQEFQDFLVLYQKNSIDAKENAVFELKLAFSERWGQTLLDIHQQVHNLIFRGLPRDDEYDNKGLFS